MAAAIVQAHCRRDPARAILPAAATGPTHCRHALAMEGALPAVIVPATAAFAVMVVAVMVTVQRGPGKVEVVNNSVPAKIVLAIVLITVPAVIGGRSITPTASITGISGTIFGKTIGPISTTIGAVVGTTIGTIATTGSMAIGGTTIRAIIGTGRATRIGGVGRRGDR